MEQLQCEVEDLQKKLRLVENSGKNEVVRFRGQLPTIVHCEPVLVFTSLFQLT